MVIMRLRIFANQASVHLVLFIVGDLIGVDGYDVFELWDFISHSLKEMALEVSPPKKEYIKFE